MRDCMRAALEEPREVAAALAAVAALFAAPCLAALAWMAFGGLL